MVRSLRLPTLAWRPHACIKHVDFRVYKPNRSGMAAAQTVLCCVRTQIVKPTSKTNSAKRLGRASLHCVSQWCWCMSDSWWHAEEGAARIKKAWTILLFTFIAIVLEDPLKPDWELWPTLCRVCRLRNLLYFLSSRRSDVFFRFCRANAQCLVAALKANLFCKFCRDLIEVVHKWNPVVHISLAWGLSAKGHCYLQILQPFVSHIWKV